MRYLIVGETALLANRNFSPVNGNSITLTTLGIPATAKGATLTLMHKDIEQKHYLLDNGRANIPVADLPKNETIAVSFAWNEIDPATKETVYHHAYGNAFALHSVNNVIGFIPAYSHTTSDVDMLWNGMAQLMETLIPFIEQYKYGNDAV